jgi:chromosomal replication initiator protein
MEDPAARRVWDTALGQLQLQVTRPNYDTWLKDTVGLAADNGTFLIGTPSDFVSEWLRSKMSPVIASTVSAILGHEVSVRFQVVSPSPGGNGHQVEPSPLPAAASPAAATASRCPANKLNPRFTFDRFVVGDGNRLAAAAALAAADQPTEVYNPLFIYGDTGLGKTHLLRAIADRSANGHRHVIYTTSEQFTNEFLTAIVQSRQDDFRRLYRSADVLLIDDIQFLCGKERTQEEFFHTFNDLHASGCQLVLTCDQPPTAITGLQSRLRSRFHWGLIADIQPPDQDTRLAILRVKASEQRVNVPPEVAHLIADRAQDNIRQLEGLLNRVSAYASLARSPIDERLACVALNALTPPPPVSPPAPTVILTQVARYFNTSPEALAGPSRIKPITEARHIAMYLLREDALLPLKTIGHLLGNRDHSTVIHGCRQAATYLNNPARRQQLNEIRSHILP